MPCYTEMLMNRPRDIRKVPHWAIAGGVLVGWLCSQPGLAAVSINVTCTSPFTCVGNPPVGTVSYTYTVTPPVFTPTLQEVSITDTTPGANSTPSNYFFTTNPSYTLPPLSLTPGHTYTATVNLLINQSWFPSACPGPQASCPPAPLTNPVCNNFAQSICGTIFASEVPTQKLDKLLVEIRDSLGQLIATTPTDNSLIGYNYIFKGPAFINGTYFVDVVLDRGENATPLQQLVTLKPDGTTTPGSVDMTVTGVPTPITVSDSSGTLVLVTTTRWTLNTPPPIDRTTPATRDYYTAITDENGLATINVPGNFTYYMTCWRVTSSANGYAYTWNGSVATPITPGLFVPAGTLPVQQCP